VIWAKSLVDSETYGSTFRRTPRRGGDQAGGCGISSPAWSIRAHFSPDEPDAQPGTTGAKPEGDGFGCAMKTPKASQ